MPDESDYFRGYARDVGLNPPIGGADNVQDALAAAAGGVTLGNNTTDVVSQDVATPLTADGALHNIDLIPNPIPTWMDGSGNIIEPGLYYSFVQILATAGATTPGLYIEVQGLFETYNWIPLDAIGSSDRAAVNDLAALAVADVPFLARARVTMPTDVTAAVTAQVSVARLAFT